MKNEVPLLNWFRADLHVHTVVSPCADIEMIPPLIVSEALHQGIDIIAITDHNSVANIASVQKAAQGTSLTVIPGMEVQTAEDVHVLCLFETLEQALSWGDIVTLLLTATLLSFEEAYDAVHKLGGLFIPAHVNRKAFGLIENLGFVPQDVPLDILEISRHLSVKDAYQTFPQLSGYSLIQNGDVHYLADFLGSLELHIAAPTFDELWMAMKKEFGRTYRILHL